MAETFLAKIEQDEKGEWKKNMQTGKITGKDKTRIPRGYGRTQIEERWKLLYQKNDKYKQFVKENKNLDNEKEPKEEILDEDSLERYSTFNDNIENYIGTVKVPVGIAGPVKVNGLHAKGEYYIPLATTEAALVASMNRGIAVINACGGTTTAVIREGVHRDPAFRFSNLIQVGEFLQWAGKNYDTFKKIAEQTTKFGKLQRVEYTIEGNIVHMRCEYQTGDASGQNMVTIATEQILNYIVANSPVKPEVAVLDGGMSGDKKANHKSKMGVRGKRVIAELKVPKEICQNILHVSPEQILTAQNVGISGLQLIGSIGINLHFSNPITAMAIALGQDPACAAEAHVGISRGYITDDGDYYISVTLPNLLVATVGGGTKCPSQRACLKLMNLVGKGKANELAEVIASVCLAGELSLGAAIVSGDFAKAHKILARDSKDTEIDLQNDPLDIAFDKAQALLVKLTQPPNKEQIMEIYGLYKQAVVGDVNISKPSFLSTDFKAKAKFEAWKKKKGIAKNDAKKKYVELVLELVKKEKEMKSSQPSTSSSSEQQKQTTTTSTTQEQLQQQDQEKQNKLE